MPSAFHPDNTLPSEGEVWVFGSNLAGRHGAGAAKVAKQRFGAVYGTGIGYMSSGKPGEHSFAIPTKDQNIRSLSLNEITVHVARFREFASNPAHSNLRFFVTRIGCGLAGFKDEDIAPLFSGFPENCIFPEEWKRWVSI